MQQRRYFATATVPQHVLRCNTLRQTWPNYVTIIKQTQNNIFNLIVVGIYEFPTRNLALYVAVYCTLLRFLTALADNVIKWET